MNLNWEAFAEICSNGSLYEATQISPNISVDKFVVERGPKNELLIKATTKDHPLVKMLNVPSGTIRHNTNELILQSKSGIQLRLNSIAAHKETKEYGASDTHVHTTISVHSIEGALPNFHSKAHTIEWLLNWPDNLIWPHILDEREEVIQTKTIKSSIDTISIKTSSAIGSSCRNCLRFNIEGQDIIIGAVTSEQAPQTLRPGFILYRSILLKILKIS